MVIGIIDYGVGNITNVIRVLEKVGRECDSELKVYRILESSEILKCDKIILPGVGAFGVAMESLRCKGFLETLSDFARSGKYMLGICLGMQLLFNKSYEFGEHKGLGLINGEVVRFYTGDLNLIDEPNSFKDGGVWALCEKKESLAFKHTQDLKKEDSKGFLESKGKDSIVTKEFLKIPHIGWNLNTITQNHPIFKNLENLKSDFYLYFVHSYHAVCDERYILATCDYGLRFPSIVARDNIIGIQPHPEKSHNIGYEIMKNFVEL